MPPLSVDILAGPGEVGRRFIRDLEGAHRVSIAVAYAKESALSAVPLEEWCGPGRQLRLLAGSDFFITDMGLLRSLERRPEAECRIFHNLDGGSFHPKVYVLDRGERRVAYVGSSNLTRGGFVENVEANVRLEGPATDEALRRPAEFVESLMASEFATPLSDEYARRYEEIQEAQRAALLRATDPGVTARLRLAQRMLLGLHRGAESHERWLLVVNPENYAICLRSGLWGRQSEHEIRSYRPGDIFLFHVTGRGRVASMGMFTGEPFYDATPLWPASAKGVFPWRIRFVELGRLVNGIPTKETLLPLRPGAPDHWFNGYIQKSHTLAPADFDALRAAFEATLRRDTTKHGGF